MTMIASWVAIDSRSASSLYIASDSRIADNRGGLTDHARKLYACSTRAHVFGYVGWSDYYPCVVLERLVEAIDSGLFGIGDDVSVRQSKVFAF